MRWLGFLVFLVGLVLSFGQTYFPKSWFASKIVEQISSIEIATKTDAPPQKFILDNQYTRVKFKYMMSENNLYIADLAKAFSLTIYKDDKKFLEHEIWFREADRISERYKVPQIFEKQINSNKIMEVGEYIFVPTIGGYMNIDPIKIHLELVGTVIVPAMDLSTYGNIAMWFGAALFIFGLRRRNRIDPAVPPTPSKWGRGT